MTEPRTRDEKPKMDVAFAHKSEVTAGTTLVADGGFTCIKSGAELTVQQDDTGELFVPCSAGRHYLDGQLGCGGRYIGLTLKVAAGRGAA